MNVEKKIKCDEDDYVIDLVGIFNLLWKRRLFISSFIGLSAILSVFIALSLPIIFKSSAKIYPNTESISIPSVSSQFGGLASLAGINLGNSSTEITIALETMKSFKFFEENLYDEIIHEISAIDSWSNETGVVFDPEIYDKDTGEWLTDKPTPQQAFSSFSGTVEIAQDTISQIITITIIHSSPYVAKKWIDLIIEKINDISRNNEIKKATKALEYYEDRLGSTPLLSVNEMFAKLTEDQHKKLMLAQIEDEYIFRTIEPSVVPEKRFKPSRAKFCLVFVFISGLLCIALIFLHDFFKRSFS